MRTTGNGVLFLDNLENIFGKLCFILIVAKVYDLFHKTNTIIWLFVTCVIPDHIVRPYSLNHCSFGCTGRSLFTIISNTLHWVVQGYSIHVLPLSNLLQYSRRVST